jgi:hypothetical protein
MDENSANRQTFINGIEQLPLLFFRPPQSTLKTWDFYVLSLSVGSQF